MSLYVVLGYFMSLRGFGRFLMSLSVVFGNLMSFRGFWGFLMSISLEVKTKISVKIQLVCLSRFLYLSFVFICLLLSNVPFPINFCSAFNWKLIISHFRKRRQSIWKESHCPVECGKWRKCSTSNRLNQQMRKRRKFSWIFHWIFANFSIVKYVITSTNK